MPETAVDQNHIGNDLRLLLDRELDRLPEKYRVAIVLCDLEGRRRREVARQLGLAEGTLSSRLATGRRLLAKRLSRRGVSLSGGLLAALLTEQAQASVPPALAKATYHAAVKVWAGQALTSLGVSTGVVTTFKGVMQAMLLTKLKLMMACLLAAGIMAGVFGSFVFGGGLADYLGSGSAAAGVEERSREANEPVKDNGFAKHLQSRPWTLKALNVEQRTITICDKPNRSGGLTLVLTNPNAVPKPPDQKGVKLEGLQLAPAAKVFINLRPAKLSDLKDGMTLLLKIAAGKTQIAEIQVISQLREDQYFVEAVDLKKQTITVKFNDSIVKLPLAKDARMIVEMIVPPGKEPQTVASPVTDVARGTPIHLEMVMEADRLAVRVLKVSQ